MKTSCVHLPSAATQNQMFRGFDVDQPFYSRFTHHILTHLLRNSAGFVGEGNDKVPDVQSNNLAYVGVLYLSYEKCPLAPAGHTSPTRGPRRASGETIMFGPPTNERFFSIGLSASRRERKREREGERDGDAFPEPRASLAISLPLCSRERGGKMLVYPEANGASLIAIPTVMAKDEADR
ncbi:hypothetical protein EYF80_018931 [Liparis tanakae]|uniref:Uncharacterized protein n=1 Tax=Liparis tanakae TaxID=230148 RepID=A0A4Z2HYJ7_9TELE|nr:hypothetical protein EYF80_018931 [Liparis tanakae]